MRWQAAVVALSVALLVPLVGGAQVHGDETELLAVGAFGQGRLYRAGPVNVVRLQGTYREMGRQYGRLLSSEMQAFYRLAIEEVSIGQQNRDPEGIRALAARLYARTPGRYKEIIDGMAETSGLGRDKQIILNAAEWIHFLVPATKQCSGLAVWGEYTGFRPLLFGRNNDDAAFLKAFAPYLTVVVLDPQDGSIPMAIVNYLGVVYAPNGMSAAGVFLELNAGNAMGLFPDRISIFTTLVSFLQDYRSVDELEPAFKSIKPELSSIVNVVDPGTGASYECSPAEARRRGPDKPGVMASSNHFVDPGWGIPEPDDATNGLTVTRRNNLLALAEAAKGHINVARMKEIMETTIPAGGATDAAGTIYQIIAEPESLTMWLRAPDNYEWQRVKLANLLRSSQRRTSVM